MMEQESLKKKYFPRVLWTEDGPVRRRYLARAVRGGSVPEALLGLAEREGFIGPGHAGIMGDAAACREAFARKPEDPAVGMIFGTEIAAHWCDIACGPADEAGYQALIVRSEEGENLTALAHEERVLVFKRV